MSRPVAGDTDRRAAGASAARPSPGEVFEAKVQALRARIFRRDMPLLWAAFPVLHGDALAHFDALRIQETILRAAAGQLGLLRG